jgi:hypothetical protein
VAAPIDRLVAPEPLNTLVEDPLAQVNSVSQLSDVQPTDWAFQALQSLVERYGCIAGYSDGTYRGNRATGRYEFTAGLNSCDSASRTSIPYHNKKPLPSLAGVKNYQGASTNICQYSRLLWGVTLHG